MKVQFTFNGSKVEWDVHPGETLFETIRREGYYGTKRGCNTGDCGTCTVLINGDPVNSCQVFTASLEGSEVRTIEGVVYRDRKTGEVIRHPVQEKFVEAGAIQCGYCIPGMVLSAIGLLEKNPNPSEEEIRRALDGNICRCTGYVKQIEAVKEAAKALASGAYHPAPNRA
ncbi:MAG: (2Fe-2S)-binding protein [Candidatus Hydrogenedentota bacterium]|nr:MAG: (2Fe-2S)-binding protein [Candidatus Hydrogenedentota bacterium]